MKMEDNHGKGVNQIWKLAYCFGLIQWTIDSKTAYHIHETLNKPWEVHKHNSSLSWGLNRPLWPSIAWIFDRKFSHVLVVIKYLTTSLNASNPKRFPSSCHLLELLHSLINYLHDSRLLKPENSSVELQRASVLMIISSRAWGARWSCSRRVFPNDCS